MANPVVGFDVSDWQGNINWDIAKTKIQFAILRASHGKMIDEHFARNVAECQRLDIPWGAYHFANPGGGLTWDVQADLFLSVVKFRPPLFCWLDAENTGGLDKNALNSWYSKWVQHVIGNGLQVGIYTSAGYWNANLPITGWAKVLPLWVANWTANAKPMMPTEWTPPANPSAYPWLFWQHSVYKGEGDEYGVESADIDLDRFNGDELVFNRQFGTHIEPLPGPEPPPPPSSVGEYQVIAAPYANLRTEPEIETHNDIGDLALGTRIKPDKIVNGWAHLPESYVSLTTLKKIG